ncbi:MAG: hypothetical protein ACP6IT_07725 [Candidatus Thorarchaeota archaeon]
MASWTDLDYLSSNPNLVRVTVRTFLRLLVASDITQIPVAVGAEIVLCGCALKTVQT